jgi:hypothetical protein
MILNDPEKRPARASAWRIRTATATIATLLSASIIGCGDNPQRDAGTIDMKALQETDARTNGPPAVEPP